MPGKIRQVIYLAPLDIQIPRVDKQCIVYFCESLQSKIEYVKLVAIRIKTLSREYQTEDVLDLYGIKTKFEVRFIKSFLKQMSRPGTIMLFKLIIYPFYLYSYLIKNLMPGTIFYIKNYYYAVLLIFLRVFKNDFRILFEIHVPPKNFLQKYLLKRCGILIANSHRLSKHLAELIPLSKINILGIHQGIGNDRINKIRNDNRKYVLRKEFGLDENINYVTYAGKIFKGSKEIENIIECSKYLTDGTQILMLGGRIDHQEHFIKYSETNKISNVKFLGFINPVKVQDYLVSSDLLITYYTRDVTTLDYLSPGKLFEYMASGTPILSAYYEILKEILGDPPCAIFVEPENPVMLAGTINDYFSNKDKYEYLKKLQLERIAEFTWEKRADKIIEFINSSYAN
jgi:glycosyltransferase involved in cell wall biosynthesis